MASPQTMEDNPRRAVSKRHTYKRRARCGRHQAKTRRLGATLVCVSALAIAGVALPDDSFALRARAAEIGTRGAIEETSVILKPGASGPEVVAMQQALWRAGFLANVDGEFGPQTEEAVRNFQREAGVKVDGIAGPTTLTLLYGRYGESQLVHAVERGESLWALAQMYAVSVDELRALNPASSDTIHPGQRLRLPPGASLANRSLTVPAIQTVTMRSRRGSDVAAGGPTPIHYTIRRGDSLSVLAHRFGTSVEEIAEENGIATPSKILEGQDLIIPVEIRGGTLGDARQAGAPRPGLLLWPVEGPISSQYGSRIHPVSGTRDFHSGLDIAVPQGTPVRSAFHGVVREARWMGDLGLAVVIDHGRGITTRYGHNSKLLVKPGDAVGRGEIIAHSGSTGLSTGPHVHFMVLQDGETRNPSDWLP